MYQNVSFFRNIFFFFLNITFHDYNQQTFLYSRYDGTVCWNTAYVKKLNKTQQTNRKRRCLVPCLFLMKTGSRLLKQDILLKTWPQCIENMVGWYWKSYLIKFEFKWFCNWFTNTDWNLSYTTVTEALLSVATVTLPTNVVSLLIVVLSLQMWIRSSNYWKRGWIFITLEWPKLSLRFHYSWPPVLVWQQTNT